MKRNIVISINPEHVKNIISGLKKFEYRKRAAKSDVSKIIIYETTPVKKIVAEAEIIDVLKLPLSDLWETTKNNSGISKKFFDDYFKGRSVGYAYKLGRIVVYDNPKTLNELGLKAAPQSFAYVN